MANYKQTAEVLQAKLATLKARYSELEERDRRVKELVAIIRIHKFTPEEIRLAFKTFGLRASAQSDFVYVHPTDPTKSWRGLARRPKWLIEYLENGGKLDDLRSDAPTK